MGKSLAKLKPEAKEISRPGGGLRKELAKYAVDDAAREPAGAGNFISIRGGVFRYRGDALEEPLKVVVLDYAFLNTKYAGDYDEENPQPPMCFAIGKTEEDLAPHPDAPEPQSETCKGCPHNAFGSAETGRGKACKNTRKLALLSTEVASFDLKHIQGAEVPFMNLPPTSLKFWKGYVRKLTTGLQLPLFAAVTSLSFDEDSTTPVVHAEFVEEVTDDKKVLNALVEKRDGVQNDLLTPGFDVSSYDPSGAKKKKKGGKVEKPAAKPARAAAKSPEKGKGKGKAKF